MVALKVAAPSCISGWHTAGVCRAIAVLPAIFHSTTYCLNVQRPKCSNIHTIASSFDCLRTSTAFFSASLGSMLARLASPIRVACLDEVRSVIRLSGAGLVHFLQVRNCRRLGATATVATASASDIARPPFQQPSLLLVVRYAQGLVTNDVLGLETPGAQPLYTCILNAQGRHLHDLFLHRTLGSCCLCGAGLGGSFRNYVA